MEQTIKKTKLDYFIGYYSSVNLEKEAKEVVSAHVNMLKAAKSLKAARVKHFVASLDSAKFKRVTKFHPYRLYTVEPKLATLVDILAKKEKTLASRKKKLAASYNTMLASNVAGKVCFQINQLLTAFEKACNNLTFKPTHAFYETLADVRETLVSYGFNKRDLWQGFNMPDSQLMLSVQSSSVVNWILELDNSAELAFLALAKFEKSSNPDDKVKFSSIIGKLKTGLCSRLYDDLNGALLTSPNQTPEPNWLDTVSVTDVIRGEYVSVPIGSENLPIALLSAKEEVSRELAETDIRLSYALEGDEIRKGIFGGIKAMAAELETGLKNCDDKVRFLTDFFVVNKNKFLQAFIDNAVAKAIESKGNTDSKHLTDLNMLLSSFSVVINPKNGESKVVGALGASDIVNYVKFTCPWLTYKANDGGFCESQRWTGPATAHKGDGFPLVINDKVCLYPPLTLMRYITVKKQIQAEVRITNRARKRHNDGLKTTPPAK